MKGISERKWSFMGIFCLSQIFYFGVAMATEEPSFRIDVKREEYEIRIYPSVLVAETKVEADFESAGNLAFRILADYIFGNNRSKEKIDMTAPVTQQPTSEKIAMTAPVNQTKVADGYMVQFTMPSQFNLTNIPLPNDSRVKLREVPGRKVAVYRYSGTWSESRYQENLQKFQSYILRDNVSTIGEPMFARFNAPFVPWFLRRNEIWIEVGG